MVQDEYRIKGSRADAVQVALGQMFPEGFTWTEQCSAEWLERFPCGVAPLFVQSQFELCTERVVEVGAHLADWDFESLLDALLTWVGMTNEEIGLGLSHEAILEGFSEREPVSAMVLAEAAGRRGLTLSKFLRSDCQ